MENYIQEWDQADFSVVRLVLFIEKQVLKLSSYSNV